MALLNRIIEVNLSALDDPWVEGGAEAETLAVGDYETVVPGGWKSKPAFRPGRRGELLMASRGWDHRPL